VRRFGQHWRRTAELIQLDVPTWKRPIFDFLESEGFKFCVDFGLDNAVEKARAHWDSVKGKRTIH
jgi:hypothetical protein